MTAAATMNTLASDVRPADTPSIGTGNASASVATTSRTSTPTTVPRLGSGSSSSVTAVPSTTAAPASTGTNTGSSRLVSADGHRLNRPTGSAGGPSDLEAYVGCPCVIVSPCDTAEAA